ncbi:DUF72 domain-containing protein [Dictyobacter formicarum]|uniref:Histidine kinase n=1 Tax=Dictyobacter formicarum TaxID=2778368 RepID=A0ABQ3VDX7_9CHLR|nr:DUF72 domain-containing protein [Dictyobacter formicarum]GHO84028.1 hypothetical protein KSZ_20340 [Dictyobacter formicarum]
MIWIGTSGWVYPHWMERFYPKKLPEREQLAYYARYFPTVEFNRSFYQLPTREQFANLYQQTREHPGFRFAVKGSRYLTHMKKLHDPAEGISRLVTAAEGLQERLGPFLYQLPPHWHVNLERLANFVQQLPRTHQAAFEFRDPTWLQPEHFPRLAQILQDAGFALVLSVGGPLPTPLDLPAIGPFTYVRFHHGAHGIGLTEEELTFWAQRLKDEANKERDVYAYFNNDIDAYAIHNALRLRELVGSQAVPPS